MSRADLGPPDARLGRGAVQALRLRHDISRDWLASSLADGCTAGLSAFYGDLITAAG